MKFTTAFSLSLSLAPAVLSQTGVSNDRMVFGNVLNSWTKLSSGWDLTRGNKTNAITLPIPKNGPIMIQPNKTALVIIDMQNFFLHESLGGNPLGRDVVPTTVNMIHAFRNAGMPVLWTNWGLTENDLINMPPALINGFTTDGTSVTSFGSDMGSIVVPKSDPSIPMTDKIQGGNQTIAVGRKLMRGSWNAQPWGALLNEQLQGVANGTDLYFNKNRLSGMWGPGTPMQTWLEDNSMTTLFFGGVNIDQCVWGTLVDSYYKGYDVILVDDIAATTSPIGATQMVDFNAQVFGWRANSTDILDAVKKAARRR
ncbi:Ureidoacrylate amidohydrolase RutB [Psilocybe cubensis]|uniref:Isochorismatase-like domain-containing protein n=2 Tax=Psilocybe cubensis TaxID=181762 RepID=A0A8H7XQQ4_PSICU|nr:Ureidoacrylate amidohydrolase RutB [Psilocybe cubensis]KAH9480817.1 Ureidoacrylate amidohydrolase RutB [Psilocybe cubensis]